VFWVGGLVEYRLAVEAGRIALTLACQSGREVKRSPSLKKNREESRRLVALMNKPAHFMMHRYVYSLVLALMATLAPAQNPFDDGFALDEATVATVKPESTEVEPGDYFKVAFTLDLKEHFHAYYLNAGASGGPPTIQWELPKGFEAKEIMFPAPSLIKSEGTISYGYEGQVTFLVEVYLDENLEKGKSYPLSGNFDWLECSDEGCFPGNKEFSFEIKVGDETTYVAESEEFFSEASQKLPLDSSAWTAQASEKENTIKLLVKYPSALSVAEPVYFFSKDKQIDSQAVQKVTLGTETVGKTEFGTVLLELSRNLGNEALALPAGEVKDTLEGLLAFKGESGLESIEVSTSLLADADLSNAAGHSSAVGFIRATDADRAAGAKVYDVSVKPEVVTLSGEKEEEVTFIYGIALLFVGGLLLNLMPCVFPVLGLKVMGFVAQAGEDESKIKKHGIVFALGLLVAMWILASVVISLGLKWGEQLANPVFLVTMIMFFFLMGLNLFGLFEIGTSLTGVGGELQAKKGYSGSFFSGVLTTLVATPCSGPFLGVAMAFALALPPFQAFIAFTVFGLGIASPYVLLSFFPALIKKLPRPGAWMESFKQIMSFFLVATAVFFMKAYMKLVGESHFNFFLFALVMVGMGAYLYGRWGNATVSKTKRFVTGYGLAGVLVFGGITWAYSTAKPPEPGLAWREWYPGIVELSRPKKRVIWVDYTADW
jgi:thiol:disulfide interchange protein DsbD